MATTVGCLLVGKGYFGLETRTIIKILTHPCYVIATMKLGQKSVKKLVGFFGDLKTPKFHSEINRPLEQMPFKMAQFSIYGN